MCMGKVGAKSFINEAKEVKSKGNESSATSVSKETSQAQEVPAQSIKDKANVSKASKFDPANLKIDIGKMMDESFPINQDPFSKLDKEGGKIDKGELNKIINSFGKKPSDIVEDIRSSKGNERNDALLNFQGTIDKMGEKDLKAMRNYLVNEMASPKNKDDELLGSLANKVNKEIDSRENNIKPWDIEPIIVGPIIKRPIFCEIIEPKRVGPSRKELHSDELPIDHKMNSVDESNNHSSLKAEKMKMINSIDQFSQKIDK